MFLVLDLNQPFSAYISKSQPIEFATLKEEYKGGKLLRVKSKTFQNYF